MDFSLYQRLLPYSLSESRFDRLLQLGQMRLETTPRVFAIASSRADRNRILRADVAEKTSSCHRVIFMIIIPRAQYKYTTTTYSQARIQSFRKRGPVVSLATSHRSYRISANRAQWSTIFHSSEIWSIIWTRAHSSMDIIIILPAQRLSCIVCLPIVTLRKRLPSLILHVPLATSLSLELYFLSVAYSESSSHSVGRYGCSFHLKRTHW